MALPSSPVLSVRGGENSRVLLDTWSELTCRGYMQENCQKAIGYKNLQLPVLISDNRGCVGLGFAKEMTQGRKSEV